MANPEAPIKFFLLVYDQAAGNVRRMTAFKIADGDAALHACFALEREHRLDRNVEIVLLGADTEQTLRKTHARYFKTVGELIASGF